VKNGVSWKWFLAPKWFLCFWCFCKTFPFFPNSIAILLLSFCDFISFFRIFPQKFPHLFTIPKMPLIFPFTDFWLNSFDIYFSCSPRLTPEALLSCLKTTEELCNFWKRRSWHANTQINCTILRKKSCEITQNRILRLKETKNGSQCVVLFFVVFKTKASQQHHLQNSGILDWEFWPEMNSLKPSK